LKSIWRQRPPDTFHHREHVALFDSHERHRRESSEVVAVRKNLDLVWVWFYKDVAPTALFKGANPAK
jgi:hypothetical protein